MEPAGRYSASPDSTTTEAANSASAASTATGGEAQQQRGESTGAATADSASGRAPDGTRSAPGAGGREPQQRPHSFSLGAIPTDQAQHRDKKRSSARTSLLAGYPEAAHRSDETGSQQVPHHQTPDSLPRPYPPQSKSFGYAPKNLARSMGSTALPRDDSTGGFAMESPMAKGDPGRAVRIDPRAPVPHGMSRSLPKQSYFPADEGEHAYYPSRSALCLHDLPQKQQYADHRYYLPPEIRKADPGGRVSSSSSFKPKRHDNRREGRYYDPFSGLIAPQNYGEADYRKQWAAYTGDQRWFYGHRCQGHHQQYAVHMVQESGRNEVFREAGDNAVLKSSGDSGGELPKYPSEQQSVNDPSSMYVYVRDAQTSTDTPVPVAGDADESPPPLHAPEMPLLGEGAARQDEGSGSSSSSDEEEEEEEESSSESSSGSVAPENKAGDATATLLPPEPAQQQLMAHHIQLQHQQVLQMTQQEYAEYQEAMRSYEQYQKKRQQQLHPLHPMQQQAMQQQMMIQQQLKQLQLQHQQQLQKQYQQQLQMQQQQQQEQQKLKMQQEQQQQPVDPGTGQFDKKRAVDFTGSNTSGAGEVGVRMPAEGASLRSFQSRTSGAENGSVEASGEDSRSLLSSSTNMGTPLLRPLLPERATRTATKDKMEHLCLAVNVILFSVLAGVVAAFIVQQVTHAI